jgi:predicted RNase H-like nuclease (RuvC/YqgF family)
LNGAHEKIEALKSDNEELEKALNEKTYLVEDLQAKVNALTLELAGK